MTDQFGFDADDQFGQPTNQNNGLRKWAESVKAENKELKDQLTQMQQTLHRQQAVNTFEDLGLPRSAASLYTGELTPDAINAWAAQVRGAFGITDQAPAGQPTTPVQPALDAQAQSQMQNFTQAGQNALPSTTIDDFQRATNNATSIQDLIASAANWSR